MVAHQVKRFSCLKDFCRTCNNNIILKKHPLDLFGDKAIVVDSEKMFGLKIIRDDGLPSRICRSCYDKISKIQAFAKTIFESKAQQESVVRAKRGKSVGDSPASATSPGSKKEKKKSKVRILSWFSKRTGTSLHNGARCTNTQIWSNKNRIQTIPRAFTSSSYVSVLLLNQPIVCT